MVLGGTLLENTLAGGEQVDGLQALRRVPAHRTALDRCQRRAALTSRAWQAAQCAGRARRRSTSTPVQRSRMPSRSASPEATTGQRGWKRQPGGTSDRIGRLAGEDLLLDLLLLGHDRQQRLRVRVLRVGEHLLGAAELDDPAEVHHGDAVGDVPRQAEVVGDGDDREPALVDERPQQRQDLAADRGVERGHRLVGEQQLRLERDRAGDQHPLALAARDLVRVAGDELLGRPQPGRATARSATSSGSLPRILWMRIPSATAS